MTVGAVRDLRTTVVPDPGDAASKNLRLDVQGLRALAVSLVLLYHLWPNRLTGGYVGVDVFFVISGFLITSHLIARPSRTGRDLADFWARRIRRLLPASLLVLTATFIASRLLAPATLWADTARGVIAAAVYGENWLLAGNAVDYLAAENSPTPVQHFWSLSVEEQFYLGWPVLILALVSLAARRGRDASVLLLIGLGAVVAASLGYSVYATEVRPPSAYFSTFTRIWELGIGALLAVAGVVIAGRGGSLRSVVGSRESGLRAVLGWTGLVAIAVAAWTFDDTTPFPSGWALLPVLGTAAVIAADAGSGPISPTRPLGVRPVQWLGGASYSVYLWHWPLIVLLPHVSGGHLGWLDKAVIIGATLLLAGLTKAFVEDAFRFGPRAPGRHRSFVLAAGGMAIVVGLGCLQLAEVGQRQAKAVSQVEQALRGDDPCFGAAALEADRECPTTVYADIVPAPEQAVEDRSDAYDDGCWVYAPFKKVVTCEYGDASSETSIALVGNSHAGQWLPTLQRLAEVNGWHLETYLASSCTPTATPVDWDTEADRRGCLRWAEQVQQRTAAGGYDLIVMSARNVNPAVGHDLASSQAAWRTGYAELLRRWRDDGNTLLVLKDTPFAGPSVPNCVADHPDDLEVCAGTPSEWLPEDPLYAAARDLDDPAVGTADLSRFFCPGQTCPPVIGGVMVYFDGSHMTATYARTMAPFLADHVLAALGR